MLVDIRRGSPRYGQWEAYELDDESLRMLYAPVGFAHGFCVTSEIADVAYKLSNYYSPDVETGFAFNDPEVGIGGPTSSWSTPSATRRRRGCRRSRTTCRSASDQRAHEARARPRP